jgi:hypothetical protein
VAESTTITTVSYTVCIFIHETIYIYISLHIYTKYILYRHVCICMYTSHTCVMYVTTATTVSIILYLYIFMYFILYILKYSERCYMHASAARSRQHTAICRTAQYLYAFSTLQLLQ